MINPGGTDTPLSVSLGLNPVNSVKGFSARDPEAQRMRQHRETEASFMRAVGELAALGGWRVYHGYLSIRSAPGFPDMVLTRPGEPVIYAEIKLDGKRPTPAQAAWLEALAQATGTEVYCWRPSDWHAIEARLLPAPGR